MTQVLKRVLIRLFRLCPLRKMIVFESHPDLSDNSYALYEELLRRGVNKRYKIYWMKTFRDGKVYTLPENVATFEQQPATLKETLQRAYVLNCSRFIIDCNSFVKKRRKNQVRIHLGHGMPIKIDLEYSRKFGDCEKYLIQSDFWREIYTEQICVPDDILCTFGYPRNDVLVNKAEAAEWRRATGVYKKVLMWMPTYRQHRRHMDRAMEVQYPYGMPCVHDFEELQRLHQQLQEQEILLLFRPHPVQDLSVWEEYTFSHIQIADDEYLAKSDLTLYELLGHTDGLITDYSSVYFDYLLTDKPVALTIEDMDEYFQHFTLAFPDYKETIKGYYVERFEELLGFVREVAEEKDSMKKERIGAKLKFHQDASGHSAAKIADMLTSDYGM
nr:CDP-glycerol glycerophosphotransferase family protein [Eubacterium sp.]